MLRASRTNASTDSHYVMTGCGETSRYSHERLSILANRRLPETGAASAPRVLSSTMPPVARTLSSRRRCFSCPATRSTPSSSTAFWPPGVAYLQKPLAPGSLSRKVRDVLRGAQRPKRELKTPSSAQMRAILTGAEVYAAAARPNISSTRPQSPSVSKMRRISSRRSP